MNLLEIVMLIIGIMIIIFSCVLVSRPNIKEGMTLDGSSLKETFTQEELNDFKEKQNELLASISDEAISKTDDYLSKISNEKIMAVSEYSDQILEKISRNHEEVVFLYNMLNNKEKELKEISKEIDLQIKAKELSKDQKDTKVENDTVKPKPRQINGQLKNIKLQTALNEELEPINTNPQSMSINNTEILKLFKQGNSVLDIARQLGIGQGEVKLVIDLFSDRRS